MSNDLCRMMEAGPYLKEGRALESVSPRLILKVNFREIFLIIIKVCYLEMAEMMADN